MVGTTFEQELNNFARSMHEQGILDHNFHHIRRLQSSESLFVTEVINLYTRDAQFAIAEVHKSLAKPSVDYDTLKSTVLQLKGASASIGGCRVALACQELRNACDDRDKARCYEAFQKVMDEYHTLRVNFSHIINLESQALVAFERTQSRPRN